MSKRPLAKYQSDGVDFIYPEGASKYPSPEEFVSRLSSECKRVVQECWSDAEGAVWCKLKDNWFAIDDEDILKVCDESKSESLDDMDAAYLISKDVYKLNKNGTKHWLFRN